MAGDSQQFLGGAEVGCVHLVVAALDIEIQTGILHGHVRHGLRRHRAAPVPGTDVDTGLIPDDADAVGDDDVLAQRVDMRIGPYAGREMHGPAAPAAIRRLIRDRLTPWFRRARGRRE